MPKYSKAASKSVEKAVHEEKRGELKSGPDGKGGTVKSRKQAIAIGLSEARKKGAKVPSEKASSSVKKSSASKSAATKTKTAAAKSSAKKTTSKKKIAKKSTASKTSKKAS